MLLLGTPIIANPAATDSTILLWFFSPFRLEGILVVLLFSQESSFPFNHQMDLIYIDPQTLLNHSYNTFLWSCALSFVLGIKKFIESSALVTFTI